MQPDWTLRSLLFLDPAPARCCGCPGAMGGARVAQSLALSGSGALSCPASRLQELYYEIVHVLNLMLEDLPQKKRSHSSEKVDGV